MTEEERIEGEAQETEDERSADAEGEGGTLGTAAKGAAAGAAAGAAIGAAATAGRDLLKSRGEGEPDEGGQEEEERDDGDEDGESTR